MSSCMNSCMNSAEPPFAAEGGIDLPYEGDADPYMRLDELMAVVEALCPVWPERKVLLTDGKVLLL